jgi:hypothetical protein
MDLDEFKTSIRRLKGEFRNTAGLTWHNVHLEPRHTPSGDLFGWNSTVIITFDASADFIRLRENWRPVEADFRRQFFSYHYGPFQTQWDLYKVICNAVTVRVDAENKGGRGYHLHDGHKNKRIHQDQLESPELSTFQMSQFINCVLAMRYGKSLLDAFEMKMK